MSYPILDIDVTHPLPSITLGDGDTGVAVLLRRKGRPLDFWLEAASPGHTFTPDDWAPRISRRAGEKILRDQLRERIAPRTGPVVAPSVTVAVCTRERPEMLARCLASLQRLSGSAEQEIPLDILVVDNAPTDDRTRDLVRAHAAVRYVREPKPGLDFARNRAIQEARGDLIAFLDDDVQVDEGWLDGLLEAWRENPDAAAFTGLVLPAELETEAQLLFEQRGGFRCGFEKKRYGRTEPGNKRYPCEAGIFGIGANMAFRRNVLLRLGGFDEALDTGPALPGGGDLDIFYRIVRAGHPLVYEPRFLVFHRHRRDVKTLRRQFWSWGLSFAAFLTKSYRTDRDNRARLRRQTRWWIAYQVRQVGRSLARRHALPPDLILAELWGGLVGLFGSYIRSARRIERIRRNYA